MSILNKITNLRNQSISQATELVKKNNKDIKPATANVIESLRRKKNSSAPSLIAELKRKSPSKGVIRPGFKVEDAVNLYEPYAAAMSILTEPDFFGGSLNDLEHAASLTSLPLLRKDFITDPVQILEARYYGASFFLLITAVLSDKQMSEMIQTGHEYNMPALVEVHSEEELDRALKADAEIIGINNRNLHDLSIDLNITYRITDQLDEKQKEKLVLVSESGFHQKKEIQALPAYIDAVLIGTSFMQAQNPADKLNELFK